MLSDPGVSMYFRDNRLRLHYRTILDLQYPQYIHLRINEEKKQLFIQKCEKDRNAFRLIYNAGRKQGKCGIDEYSCHINDKRFLRYLSHVVGVPVDSPSLRFRGAMMNDGRTVYIDLTSYEQINLLTDESEDYREIKDNEEDADGQVCSKPKSGIA